MGHWDSAWVATVVDRFLSGAAPIWEGFDNEFGITPSESLPKGWDWGAWAVGHVHAAAGATHRIWEQKLTRDAPRVGWLPQLMLRAGVRDPFLQHTISRLRGFKDWGASNFGQCAPRDKGSKTTIGRFLYNLGQNRVPRPFKGKALTYWGESRPGIGPSRCGNYRWGGRLSDVARGLKR